MPDTDPNQKDRSGATKLVGADANGVETEFADVEVILGKRRLLTDAAGKSSLEGWDNNADAWFCLGTEYDQAGVGAAGNTVTVTIGAGSDATLFPPVSVVTTVQAADVAAPNKEISFADRIVSTLNSNPTFTAQWVAKRVANNAVVHIVSRITAMWSERQPASSFAVVATGTTVVFVPYDTIVRRLKLAEVTRDRDDPRYGSLGISGSVTTTPGGVGDLFITNALNGASPSMLVNGSVTPVDFTIPSDATKDLFVQEIRFYGGGNGVKFGQILAKNTILTNGILVTIKSDDATLNLPVLKTTEDFKNKFSFSAAGAGAAFRIDIQAGSDQFAASFVFSVPFPLRRTGTFTSPDFIRVRIQDDCVTIGSQLQFLGYGFRRSA